MQYSSTAAGTAHQIEASRLGQGQPMALQGPLVQTERQGGAAPPAIEPQGWPALTEQQCIESHLPIAGLLEARQ